MTFCPRCGTEAAPGALFCVQCGATVPQFEPPVSPVPSAPPTGAMPPPTPPAPEWIPESLRGRAVHCPTCNTLISPVAVMCPACLSPLPSPAAAAGADAPRR